MEEYANKAYSAIQNLSPAEKDQVIRALKKQNKDIDDKFLNAVLFPEVSPPARWPIKYASQQTALFTHRFHTYLGTGTNGQGRVSLMPKEIRFPCLTSSTNDGTGASWDGNPSNGPNNYQFFSAVSDGKQFIQSYSNIRLVGCSIRLQYMGPVETESGILVGSHTWEHHPTHSSEENIENGYHVHRGRPTEGIRLVWLPKDKSDCDFYGYDYSIVPAGKTEWPSTSGSYYGLNPNAYWGDDAQGDDVQELQLVSLPIGISQVEAEEGVIAKTFGTGARGNSNTPELLEIYWRGLPSGNPAYWRIDVERHFEGIPRTAVRDIVSVAYPQYNQKSLDVVTSTDLHSLPVASHSQKEGSFWTTVAKPFIKNIGTGLASAAGAIMGGPAAGAIAGAGTQALMGAIFGNDHVQHTYEKVNSAEFRGQGGLDHSMGTNGTFTNNPSAGEGYKANLYMLPAPDNNPGFSVMNQGSVQRQYI